MGIYGEIEDVEDESFALADDEEYDGSSGTNHLGLTLEKTVAGESFAQMLVGSSAGENFLLCLFEGKVAVGFGEGYIGNQANRFEQLASVFITGNEGTVDSLMSRNTKRRPVARIYRENATPSKNIIFILVDQYGLPRSLVSEVANQIQEFVAVSKQVVVFRSEPNVFFKFNKSSTENKLFYVKSSSFDENYLKILSAIRLPKPNMIAGVGASVALHCEMVDKPAVIFASYHDNEIVDSISMRPLFKGVQKIKASEIKSGNMDIGEIFSHLVHSLKLSAQCNISHVSQTNLYV